MDIPSTLNAPRFCRVGGKYYWVRAMSLEGLGIVLGWLDDVIPGDRPGLPHIGSPEAQAALESRMGITILTWLALRDSGVTFEEAAELAFIAADTNLETEAGQTALIDHLALCRVLFGRRKTKLPSFGSGDIADTWCAEGMAELAAQYGLENIGKLSIDQYEWLSSSGMVDGHASPQALGYKAAMRLYEARQAELEAEKANGSEVAPSTP